MAETSYPFQMMEVFPEDPELLPFAPVCDDNFLPESPAVLLEKRAFNPVNMMAGYTAEEGSSHFIAIFSNVVERPHCNKTIFENLLTNAKMTFSPLARDAMELVYFDDSMLSNPDPDYFDAFVKIFQDHFFSCSTDTYLRGAAQADVGSVYAYMLTHHPSVSLLNAPWTGATHCDDLVFFGVHFTPNRYNLNDEEVDMTLKMITYWTNFAKTG